MAKILIESILEGIAPTQYFASKGQYGSAIGIDPEFPVTDTGVTSIRSSGIIRPVAYQKFSDSNVNAEPIGIITSPKNTNVYISLSNGRLISYNSSLASETLIGSAGGKGAVYYSDYIYLMTATDVDRYGPLSASPSITTGVWTGSTLGTQTALAAVSYPAYRGGTEYPSHWGHVHTDDKLYFGDANLVNYIKTNSSGTNDGSTRNALDLPAGFNVIDIESYGNDIVIAAVQTVNATIASGTAALFFWDTFSASFYRVVVLPDPFVTALKNNNGILHIWAGKLTTSGGHTLYRYAGGDSVVPVATMNEGHPPLPGAVDAVGNKVVWGSYVTYPDNSACVWGYGSKDGNLPVALHNIATSTASASSTAGIVTALRYATHGAHARPEMVIGWRDASAYGLDKLSTTYQTHYWRSKSFNIGKSFTVRRVAIPLAAAVASNVTITPKILLDDESSSTTGTVINSTNYPNSERKVIQYPAVNGRNNFILELKSSGTVLCPVNLPIEIDLDIKDD